MAWIMADFEYRSIGLVVLTEFSFDFFGISEHFADVMDEVEDNFTLLPERDILPPELPAFAEYPAEHGGRDCAKQKE